MLLDEVRHRPLNDVGRGKEADRGTKLDKGKFQRHPDTEGDVLRHGIKLGIQR